MTGIYDRGARNNQRRNPARSLYAHWLGIFRALGKVEENAWFTGSGFRNRNWGIGIEGMDANGRPILAFGETYGANAYSHSSGHYSRFDLLADGRFRLHRMWGVEQRGMIAQHTFLTWGWIASRYQWAIGLEHGVDGRYWGDDFTDWQNPVSYLSEEVMGIQTWNRALIPWWVVKPADEGWIIAPARNQQSPTGGKSPDFKYIKRRYDAYAEVREKRYREAQVAWRVNHGMTVPGLSARHGKVTDGGREIEPDEAVKQIIALLDVHTPAKTTPLQRGPKEALNGNRMVTTHQA